MPRPLHRAGIFRARRPGRAAGKSARSSATGGAQTAGVNFAAGRQTRAMLDVGCWMLDVGCWMFDVGCWMLDVGCWMLDVGCSRFSSFFVPPMSSQDVGE